MMATKGVPKRYIMDSGWEPTERAVLSTGEGVQTEEGLRSGLRSQVRDSKARNVEALYRKSQLGAHR